MSRPARRCSPVPEEVRQTADLLERRWQLSIIYAALSGAMRFSEFAEAIAGISPRMLSERLRAQLGELGARAHQRAAGARSRVHLPARVADEDSPRDTAERDEDGGDREAEVEAVKGCRLRGI